MVCALWTAALRAQPAVTAADTTATNDWSYALNALFYLGPDERNFVVPIVTADHNALHLEARYNYEGEDLASAWAGLTWSFGDSLSLVLTPMVGVIFGDARGFAPGLEATLAWRGFELYSESEYVFFDSDGRDDDFFYNWTTGTFALPRDFSAGFLVQRTRAYHTDREAELGVLGGYAWRNFDFTLYALASEDPIVIAGISVFF